MKTCSKCKVPREESEFDKNATRKDGFQGHCKECCRGYRNANKEGLRAYRKKSRKKRAAGERQFKYGITPEDFERMLAEQVGVCAICSGSGGKRELCVDHDHESGKVRALLCDSCNIALGKFKDSSSVVQNAADYLKRHGK